MGQLAASEACGVAQLQHRPVPHIGSATTTARARMAEIAVDNILVGLTGASPPNLVNL